MLKIKTFPLKKILTKMTKSQYNKLHLTCSYKNYFGSLSSCTRYHKDPNKTIANCKIIMLRLDFNPLYANDEI